MEHILHVEDDPAHAFLVKKALQELDIDCRLTQVPDGLAALDYLHHRNEFRDADNLPSPTIILLDLRLPKVDGLEVLSDIKGCEQTRGIPVIILSTSVAENDIRKAYDKYANSYLVKPAGFVKLVELLRHIKEYWLDCNRHLH